MQKVQRLGRRKGTWLALPVAIALGAATALLWPQPASTQVLVANRDLSEGTLASAADFTLQRVKLGDSASLYLSKFPAGGVVISRLAKGQLLARSALAPSPLQVTLATVLTFKDQLPLHVREGSRVDIWATERADGAEPSSIAQECVVANLTSQSSLGQKTTSVEVNCLPEFLPMLLKAKATDATLALVLQPSYLDQ
jgi:hypothetical protein